MNWNLHHHWKARIHYSQIKVKFTNYLRDKNKDLDDNDGYRIKKTLQCKGKISGPQFFPFVCLIKANPFSQFLHQKHASKRQQQHSAAKLHKINSNFYQFLWSLLFTRMKIDYLTIKYNKMKIVNLLWCVKLKTHKRCVKKDVYYSPYIRIDLCAFM